MTKWSNLFTSRQLVALTTFSDLISSVRELIIHDAKLAGMKDDNQTLESGGEGATAYADAVAILLGLGIGRLANRSSSLNFWDIKGENVQQVFARQALAMTWDFTEGNPFSESSGNWEGQLQYLCRAIEKVPCHPFGHVFQEDAQTQKISAAKIISTDPPYYDNIGYADLSDFFYVWLRRALRPILPSLFATLAVPKAEELVATPYRHGNKDKAETFFMEGMTKAMHSLSELAHPSAPITIYYAFKQSETDSKNGTSSSGWETFLEAIHRAGLALTGTWPMRTEYTGNLKKSQNSLASSIVLVCRPRPIDAPSISRREFIRELNSILPEALDDMTRGTSNLQSPVAPVDLSQAIIGPGMGVFSKYASVLEADGSPMSVKTALQLINRFLAEDDFDADTQWCLHWFEQSGWKEGLFGDADVLARSKAIAVDGLAQAGIVNSGSGVVRLLKWAEYHSDWDPTRDSSIPIWAALHHLIRTLKQGGELAAGAIIAAIPSKAEAIRQLAYRLYTLCERQGWVEDARVYNELITSWSGIETASSSIQPTQRGLFD